MNIPGKRAIIYKYIRKLPLKTNIINLINKYN